MFLLFVFELPGKCLINANHLLWSRQRNQLIVVVDVRREHDIKLITDASDAVARGNVIERSEAGMAVFAAAHEYQFSIARKRNRLRFTFGEGKDPHQLTCLAMIKRDLHLSANSDQR